MCGLFGVVTTKGLDKKVCDRALNTMAHRGPDAWDGELQNSVYFGHRRLSIIDLSEKGRQPMHSSDGEVSLIFNGEIYNYKELKQRLDNEYDFQNNSDSEVLIYGYKKWGFPGLLKQIEGIFAFSIHDRKKGTVFVARDRVGVKPIYYSDLGGEICFSSELKGIVDYYSSMKLEIDNTAIYDFLTYSYVPTPKTLYKDVYKLPPAHYIEIDTQDATHKIQRYWQLEYKPIDANIQTVKDRLIGLVDEAVESQLMSDVPVGFFLSGGIDSSVVVATAAKYLEKIDTYSIGFDYGPYDETKYAQIIAELFKTNHTVEYLEAETVGENFSDIKAWYDEPFADSSAFPTNLVSKLASKASTVVLSGDGGDEIFGGYTRYADFYNWQSKFSNKITTKLKSQQERVTKDLIFYNELFGPVDDQLKRQYRQKLGIPEDYDDLWYYRKFYRLDLPPRIRLQYLDIHTYLHDDILTKVDRASMRESIEARVPLLATELIEYAFTLPEEIIYSNGNLKGLLKEAYKGKLPDSIINKNKKGFSIPYGIWKERLGLGGVGIKKAVLDLYQDQI